MDIEKLIEQLNNLEACAYGYHINGEVLGMDCSEFEQIMVDAADEISKVPMLQAENEKLRAELEQVKRCLEIVEHQREAAIDDMTALMAGQCCDLCAVEYCNDRGKTEMCTAFKWRGTKEG